MKHLTAMTKSPASAQVHNACDAKEFLLGIVLPPQAVHNILTKGGCHDDEQ